MVKDCEESNTTVMSWISQTQDGRKGTEKSAWPYVHLTANNEYVGHQFNYITD